MSPTLQELVQAQERVQRIVWAALLMSIFTYGVVVHVVAPSAAPSALAPAVWAVLAMAAMGAGGLSLAWPSIALSDQKLRAVLSREPVTASAAGAAGPGTAAWQAQHARLDARERRLFGVVSLGFTTLIIRLALNESLAIQGLVLAFLSHDPRWFWMFAVPAIVLDLAMFPRLMPLIERAQALVNSPALPE